MSDMVDRMAIRLIAQHRPDLDWNKFSDDSHTRREYRGLARAAIEAMEVPTDAMVNAFFDNENYGDAEHFWRVMWGAAAK